MAEPLKPGPTSRVLHCDRSGCRWMGIEPEPYKTEAGGWADITRWSLVGTRGESTRFHLRYFEIAPGGCSSLERHQHEHVVIAVRGHGEILLEDRWEPLHPGDVAYTAPGCVHQVRPVGDEPFGFFCIVDAERDRPVVLDDGASCELR